MIPVVGICLVKGSVVALICFVLACLSDYLDGYAARTFSNPSRLGEFLDPLADKLLVASTLLLLAGMGQLSRSALIPATIILCREIIISGLREFVSSHQTLLPVTKFGKWKTTIQMVALTLLLSRNLFKELDEGITYAGEIFLWIASILSIISAVQYIKKSFFYFE